MEAVVRRENVTAAYQRVVRNSGAPGVDGVTVDGLRAYCQTQWDRIRQELLEGRYQPQPIRKVEIPKPEGGQRRLGIPTVMDRMIQQAVLQILQPFFDPLCFERQLWLSSETQRASSDIARPETHHRRRKYYYSSAR